MDAPARGVDADRRSRRRERAVGRAGSLGLHCRPRAAHLAREPRARAVDEAVKAKMLAALHLMCYARRPQAGGGWGAPREGPRCPEVPGCFPGALPGWPPPRAGRAGGAARGVPVTPGTSQGGVNPEVRPKK